MQPQKPYLIRAFYDWIVESECTPYLLINATLDDVIVPMEYVEDGEIVLNVAPAAVKNLEVDNGLVTFEARFSGNPMTISVPTVAVLAIYANENGRGMVFHMDEEDSDDQPPPGQKAPGKPNLKLVE